LKKIPGKRRGIFVMNDVRLEDILNAPSSLSVSLKTATEIFDDNNSFFRSDEKKSQCLRYKNNVNDSYLVYQDEASMIKEATDDEEDDKLASQNADKYVLRSKNNRN
jgi:hypothetical protein